MTTQTGNNKHLAKCYGEIFERLVDDAAFLWLLRAQAVNQPHYDRSDLFALDCRVDAYLDALNSSGETAWEYCINALDTGPAEYTFIAVMMAFHLSEKDKIQHIVEFGVADETAFRGLVSAFGWLSGACCHPWMKKFLLSEDPQLQHLAIAACGVRRENPQAHLTRILHSDRCADYPPLHCRALRLAGELKRRDLLPVLQSQRNCEDTTVVYWANWASALLGDAAGLRGLQKFLLTASPFQNPAIDIVLRASPIAEAREWINLLAQSPDNARQVIRATAALGDPHALPWLVNQTRVPQVARVAGEAFTTISGVDLTVAALALREESSDADADVHDEDLHLPVPDPEKITQLLPGLKTKLGGGYRCLLGNPVEDKHLQSVFASCHQRHRKSAALELALRRPDQILMNHASKKAAET